MHLLLYNISFLIFFYLNTLMSNIPTYILGLKEPTKKIKYLKKFGINANWFVGVNPDNQTDEIFREYASPFYNLFAQKSVLRIGITHMQIWELAIKNKNPYTMIFEDDVVLNKEFNKYLDICLNNVPDDFDILYLGAIAAYKNTFGRTFLSLFNGILPSNYKDVNDYIKIPHVAVGVHAYVISQKGAVKLLSLLKGKLGSIDFDINILHLNKKIKRYLVYPELAYQTSTFNINKSNNIKSNFPILLNTLCKNIKVDKYVTLDYLLNASPFKTFNIFFLLFLIFGIILVKICKFNFATLNLMFFILLYFDLISCNLTFNTIQQVIFFYLIFITPLFF